MFQNLSSEVQMSTFVGMCIGGNTAWLVWLIRTYEKHGDSNYTPELQLSADSLNFDDTEETKSNSCELFGKKQSSPRDSLWFGGDEEDEEISLIKNKDSWTLLNNLF